MKKYRHLSWLILACSSVMAAQATSHPAVVARIVVTNNSFYQDPPPLTADNVVLTQDYKPLPITTLLPLKGAWAELELYILVDASANCEFGDRLKDLVQFLSSQPPTTSIGVAYIQDGRLEVVQEPTHDRAQAIQALRPHSRSKPSNPFRPLAELIEGWHDDSSRHVVLMITNGINPGATSGQQDVSVETALHAAQRAGVAVYSIYNPGPDYLTSDTMALYSGQVQLAHLAIETGGTEYFQGLGPLPSFAPSLEEMAKSLANQYLVEFVMKPDTQGALQDVSVRSKTPDVYLSAPWKVWVPAPPTRNSGTSTKTEIAGHKATRRKSI